MRGWLCDWGGVVVGWVGDDGGGGGGVGCAGADGSGDGGDGCVGGGGESRGGSCGGRCCDGVRGRLLSMGGRLRVVDGVGDAGWRVAPVGSHPIGGVGG